MLDRDSVVERVSTLLGDRPVRWSEMAGDYDGSECTLEVFEADAGEQRGLLRALRPVRAELEAAAGGPLVLVFHTRAESRRLYADVLSAWQRKRLAQRVAEWIEQPPDTDPPFELTDVDPLRLQGAA